MCEVTPEMEDRIFELLGTRMTAPEIIAEVGLERDDGLAAILKVLDERGTPRLAAAKRAVERAASIRFI